MSSDGVWQESFLKTCVSYHLEVDGQLVIVENVPARVNVETGERLFSPETVEHLQAIVTGRRAPVRIVETPVYEYG